MKKFIVYYTAGSSYSWNKKVIEANWFRVTLFSRHGIFYRGLRKVAWVDRLLSVSEEVPGAE